MDVLDRLRARTSDTLPLHPVKHTFHAGSGLYNEGVWHNCLAVVVSLRAARRADGLQTLRALLALNMDETTGLLRRRTLSEFWEHGELEDVVHADFYRTPSADARALSQAAAVLATSFARDAADDADAALRKVASALLDVFWDEEDGSWRKVASEKDAQAVECAPRRAVDQALCMLACMRLLVTWREGDPASPSRLRLIVRRTARFLLGIEATYADRSERVAWHDVWVAFALLVTRHETGCGDEIVLAYVNSLVAHFCRPAAGIHLLCDAAGAPDTDGGANTYAGDNALFGMVLRALHASGIGPLPFPLELYERDMEKLLKTRSDGLAPISNRYTAAVLWANTELALSLVLRPADFEWTSGGPVYLDYNATTPHDPRVAAAMLPFVHQHFGNPSSSHVYGQRTKQAVDQARAHVAHMLNAADAPAQITFVSGGTEANNWVLRGLAELPENATRRHIVTTAFEHPAIDKVCKYMEEHLGFSVTYVPVRGTLGSVAVDDVLAAVRPGETMLVTVMHANNEVGTLQPIGDIARGVHAIDAAIAVHTDASQSVGKVPIDVQAMDVDFLTVAGHKLYAPKGIGALYARRPLAKFMYGAGHEFGRRAGTESVILIAGLGEACRIVADEYAGGMSSDMRDRLHASLGAPPVNGTEPILPNTLSVQLAGLSAIDDRLVACSRGSACHAHSTAISPVLAAMGLSAEQAGATLRLSTGRFTTADDIDLAVDVLREAMR